MGRYLRFLFSLVLYAWSMPSVGKFLYRDKCLLKDDPSINAPSIITTCVNASAGTLVAQKSKRRNNLQPPVMHRADGEISLFVTPWASYSTKVHSRVFISRETQETLARESIQDLSVFQIGNNALSRHRVMVGRGSPEYRLNHQTRKHYDYIWGLANYDAPKVQFATYTYDNQLDLTFQFSYGINPDRNLSVTQSALGSARIMYDLAALEGTRIVLGGFIDGTLHRAITFGTLNVNGIGAETAFEVTRTFATNPYDPQEFGQNIRLSYLSPLLDLARFKFQYDDQFKFIRLVGLGGVYYPSKHAEMELHFGYAKQEDVQKLSHVYGVFRAGVRI